MTSRRRLRQSDMGATTVSFAYTPVGIVTKNVDDRVLLEYGVVPPTYIGGQDPRWNAGPTVIQATQAQAVATTTRLAAAAGGAPGAINPTRAQQATLNTAVSPSAAAAADAAAATLGRAVVRVPAMYAGTGHNYTDANRARSSIQDYFFQPTFVSQILPISQDAHAVAIAATLAEPALLH